MAANARPGCAAYGEISGKPLDGMGHLRAAPLICADRLLAGLAARAVTGKDGIASTLRLKKA
jgi:hypothetical protein